MPLDLLVRNIRLLGILAIAISLGTWTMDFVGWVYVCPYCRTQRTVIGLLGLLMVLSNPRHWLVRYVGAVLGVLGAVVAVMHFFRGFHDVLEGDFSLDDPWYLDSMLLSGFAIGIITAQVLLLFQSPADRRDVWR